MDWIQEAAEKSVRTLLIKTASTLGNYLEATESLDDGSDISIKITINPTTGDSVFDFTDSAPEVYGNLNAPKAVTYSAVIYCLRLVSQSLAPVYRLSSATCDLILKHGLRCLIGFDVPLNQGCLNPIEIKLKEGSILCPSDSAAVVGGNVLTSQRVVDVVLKAFFSVSASQEFVRNDPSLRGPHGRSDRSSGPNAFE